MHLASSFGNLGRLAELERRIESMEEIEKNREIASFVETLPPDEFNVLIPRASEEVLGVLFRINRARLKEALDSLNNPLRKGKALYQIASSLPKNERKNAQNLLSECLSLGREALRDTTSDPQYKKDAHILLAQVFGSKGNITGAIQEIRKCLQISADPVGYAEMAKLYRLRKKSGDEERAQAAFEKAIELNPQFQPAYLELSRCHESQGQIDESIEVLKKLDHSPDTHPGIYNELGTLHKKKYEITEQQIFKKYDDIKDLQNQIEKVSPFYNVFFLLSKELCDRYEYPSGSYDGKKQGEYLPSRREKNNARIAEISKQLETMKTDPRYTEGSHDIERKIIALYEEIVCLYQSIISEQGSHRFFAIHYYQKAIKHPKSYGPAHLNLGRVYFHMGRLQLAIKHHQLAVDVGVHVARYFLARLYLLDTHCKDVMKGKKLLQVFIATTERHHDELSVRYLDDAKETLSKISL